ncbi:MULTISPECIES: tripartite tricarboxylate transporter TctB family protein [unclassified Bosea (in: a-proteobacteria)]|uniref:tripartite tricarboxylate transporter TctB family protein n=1 Tax=unclassified Bosea (in: a-proteobacteria) TaxID=2653178 RepID=UPI00095665BD|nr:MULTISPECIES: tripartite tricarboxylate transporter TctB family protein [unclassified Bosea (in: a-proteobacteria)]TAJ34577.1 MAG: tripartite tricarboxylate transporter TctB family protein [Bosea sp. (in: a-proteobacteria)]SIQ06188.1 Tripartite tricarboxylate transporter TctB family protein [Bosea sp. TND4EK4]
MSLNQIERGQGLRIRSTQDLAGGLFMIVLALGAFAFSWDLSAGTLRQLGPGMLPKAFAVICGVLGLMLVFCSLRYEGEALSGWSWKGVFFVLGGACLFALTIRGFEIGPISVPALGLLVSGPLLILYAGLAADDLNLKQLVIFAIAMSAACIALFKYALSLPIPLAPWLLGI